MTRLIVRFSVFLVPALLMATGCSWFRKGDSVYAQSGETRPLEVPPDLTLPDTEGAMQLPGSAGSVARPAPTRAPGNSSSGFTVPGTRDAVFVKVGEALAATTGVTIASRAQLLGTYDVNYGGSDFLVRVTAVEAGVYVSAVDPRGMPATAEAATRLVAALRSALAN
ncbi:MAG TPA: hypothetical protein VNI56_02900 [Xanthomonadaceae bacterium]|nr:hypothetical protein [Xanthomonadaceae bacterium]